MTSTMTTHAYVNETNPGENSFFRVPNDGIPDGARGIRFMLDYSTDEGKAENRLFKKYFTIHNNNGKLSVKQVGLLDAEEMESFEVTVIASYRLNGQKHEISHRIVVNVVDVIQNNEIEYLEIGADAGTQLGVVKFAGKDATYTVKNAATNTVSTDFVVGSTGMLEVKQGASLSSQADYALIITTGEGASARSINVNVRVRAQSEVTGNFVAEEDITIFDPSGQIQLVDELVDDASSYQLSVNGAAVTGEDTRISATYGHLLVDADGDWHYVLDNTNTNVEALHGREGEDGHQLTETVTYSFTKGDQVITGSFTITINGRTDITYSAFDDLEAENFEEYVERYNIQRVDEHLTLKFDGGGYTSQTTWIRLPTAEETITDPTHDHHTTGGDDVIFAQAGQPMFYRGGDGDDILIGSTNTDHIGGGPGVNVLDGGDGDDTAYFHYFDARGAFVNDLKSPTRYKYDATTDSWVAGTGEEYTYRLAWADNNQNGVFDEGDWGDYFRNFERFDGDGTRYDDLIVASDTYNTWTLGLGDDTYIGGSGYDQIEFAGLGINRAIGGAGESDYLKLIYHDIDVNVISDDPNAAIKWKYDATSDSYSSGTGDGYIYSRVWADVNGNGVVDDGDAATYHTGFEWFIIESGGDGDDTYYGLGAIDFNIEYFEGIPLPVSSHIASGNGDDTLYGSGYGDKLHGQGDDDTLYGNGGRDQLFGGAGDDIFVLRLNPVQTSEHVPTYDIVKDFRVNGDNDKIRVDTANGNEQTLAALEAAANIRIDGKKIYTTGGTADTADDVWVMDVQGLSGDLDITHFDIV